MIPMLIFSALAALLVLLAGRGDVARDPRLTLLALALLVVFPLLGLLPKLPVLPAPETGAAAFPLMKALSAIWATGFLFAALRLGIAARAVSAWRKRSQLVSRIDRVEIRQLPGLKGPVAAGVFRPVIFVPEEWTSWPEETCGIILNHEMAHHRRRDPLRRWIAEIACVVSGCNPLVIWMARRLTAQCEFACDAEVLSRGVPATRYARVLCDFAEARVPRGPVLAMAGASSLESRVRRLLAPRSSRGSAGIVVLILLTVGIAGLLATLGSRGIPVSPAEVELRWTADPFPGGK